MWEQTYKRAGIKRPTIDNKIIFSNFKAINITERKAVEAQLRRSQQSLVEAQRIGRSGSWEVNFIANTATWSDNLFGL